MTVTEFEQRERVKLAKEAGLKCIGGLQPQKVEWIWYPYIPRGKITILQGDPGGGKTTLALNLISWLSNGAELPIHEKCDRNYCLCVYQTAEDGYEDTVLPRLNKAGADTNKVFYLPSSVRSMNDSRLETVCFNLQPDLVVLDPLQGYLGSDVDMHRANEIRPIMSYLGEMADLTGVAFLLIGHMNKNTNTDAIYRGLGSIDIAAAARSVLLMEKPKRSRYRVLRHIKSSLAPNGKPLAFDFNADGKFYCAGEYTEEVNSAEKRSVLISYKLRTMLAGKELPARDVLEALEKEFGKICHSSWTDAKRLAQAETIKKGSTWKLRISPDADFTQETEEDG